jgi:hypothetical protein
MCTVEVRVAFRALSITERDGRGAMHEMTSKTQETSQVTEATEADARQGVRKALRDSGHTFEELAEQAKSGRFDSLRSRLAWLAISDLGPLAPR